jgi:hypothetical protein
MCIVTESQCYLRNVNLLKNGVRKLKHSSFGIYNTIDTTYFEEKQIGFDGDDSNDN